MILNFPLKKKLTILSLGAESAGNFSIYLSPPYHSLLNKERCLVVETERSNGKIFFSEDFGDLLEEKNWIKYQASVLEYLKNNKIKPQIILTDLHPLYKTTLWGEKLAKKFSAKFVQVQHHHAHIFSAIGDRMMNSKSYKLEAKSYCIAMDGTGLGTDEKIWGGEVFKINKREIQRIGHLENQVMIGGDLAIREPARMLIGVLSNKEIYPFVKKFYTKNEFELIYNQLQQNFNCQETSSTGRVLDAVSVLLSFCGNKRSYKHEPIDKLQENSTLPYSDLKPKIIILENKYVLDTTYLFNYVINYLHKRDKHRLAATAQLYIAEGLYEIIRLEAKSQKLKAIYIAGGLANNKIISEYLISKGAYASTKIPRGDVGLSFGQIIYYLLEK